MEVVSLDGIDASLAKKFQKPFGCTVDGINVGGSAKDRIGIRCAEALLVAERRRSAFARCAEDGAKEQEEKERKKSMRRAASSCHLPHVLSYDMHTLRNH